MERAAEEARARVAASSPNRSRSVGRRDYDKALSRRLMQLNQAMGIDDSPAPPPPADHCPPPAEAKRHSSFQPSTLILTAFVSGLAGAGAMWLALGSGAPPRVPVAVPPLPPAIIAPVVNVATPTTVAPITAKPAESLAEELVEGWRTAWSKRDAEAYLSFYSPEFMPADGSTRANWAVARRKNLASRSDIQVAVRQLEITVLAENRLKVSFQQDYTSGNYRENAQLKTLLLSLDNGRWQIVEEWSGVQTAEKKAR